MKNVFVVGLALMLGMMSARADVRIASESRSAAQLSPQSTSYEVQINPAARLARVTSTWVFNNTSPADFEAEFVAQSPPNTLMTQFAYWFKGQKTLARVVEKSRAARIYSEATSAYRPRPRDPALVEMLARNLYRVTVAPVEAKIPLRIEVVWLQPLEKNGAEWRLTLPWSEGGRVKKASWSLKATFSAPVQNLDSPFVDARTSPTSLEFNPPSGTELPGETTLSWTCDAKAAWLQSRTGGDGYFVGLVEEAVWKKWEN